MLNREMQECADECLRCHSICLREAMNHCLEVGGRHTEPGHFRLMLNCAEICQTSADFLLSGSPLHTVTCNACAQICGACRESCADLGNMDECVEACGRCADSCRKMA